MFQLQLRDELAYIIGLLFGDSNMNNWDTIVLTQVSTFEKAVLMLQVPMIMGIPLNMRWIHDRANCAPQFLLYLTDHFFNMAMFDMGFTKTKRERTPKNIPENMERHFIRGNWDADGNIMDYRKGTKGTGNYKIQSSIGIVDYIGRVIKRRFPHIEIYFRPGENEKVSKILYISGRKAAKEFFQWLYQKGDLCRQDNFDKAHKL